MSYRRMISQLLSRLNGRVRQMPVLGPVFERIQYEADRTRRILPTVVRFGVSGAEDYIKKWRTSRAAADHVVQSAARRKSRHPSRRAGK